jgi:poly [ADP-ribose] polymerase 7/11/12/13
MNKKASCAPRYLFHGTKGESVPQICKDNFDWRLYGTSAGSMYGQGAYFATTASKSNNYSSSDENGIRHMFVACVLVGSYIKGKKEYRRPPPKFDSCVDNVIDPNIFALFDGDQYYPQYLVKYKVY